MLRYILAMQTIGLGLIVGCSDASRTEIAGKGEVKQTAPPGREAVVAEAPDLKAVPASSTSRATEAFSAIVLAAEAGDAEAWTKAEGELHELGMAAVPALTERLSDKNGIARELAAMFLAQLGPDAVSAAEGLIKLLEDPSSFARVNAAAALSTFDGHSERVVPVLISLLADQDVNVRITAATSLRNVGPSATQAIDTLTRSLLDGDARVRAAAAVTLGELGPAAMPSVPTLRRLDTDDDEQVQAAAARAIRQIDETARTTSVTIPASATE